MINEEDNSVCIYDIKGLYPLMQKAREELKNCNPIYMGGNCWKYMHAEQVLEWFNMSKKCIMEKRVSQSVGELAPLKVPDDF